MLKVLITDDHAMIRVGLKQVLQKAFSSAVIGETQNAQEALEQIRSKDWDLAIMDITMPGRSGIDILQDIKLARPNLPVLIMSMHGEDQFAVRVLKAGAAGFISKHSPPEELVKAIQKLLGGGRYVSHAVTEKLISDLGKQIEKLPHEVLSDRELQVICLFATGKTNKEVAKELSISVKTVSTYRARILEKMKMKSNAELTRYAIKNQLVE